LLEIVVVITLIALVTTLMVPKISQSGSDSALRADVRRLISIFRLARSEAITSQARHRVCFDSERNAVWVETEREASGGAARSWRPLESIDFGSALESRARERADGDQRLPTDVFTIDERIQFQVKLVDPERYDSSEPAPPAPARVGEQASFGKVALIYFRPDGTSNDCEVILRDSSGYELALLVEAVTSAVSLETRGRQVAR